MDNDNKHEATFFVIEDGHEVQIKTTVVHNTLSQDVFGALIRFVGFPYRYEARLYKTNFFLSCLQVKPFEPIGQAMIHLDRVSPHLPLGEYPPFETKFKDDVMADWNL